MMPAPKKTSISVTFAPLLSLLVPLALMLPLGLAEISVSHGQSDRWSGGARGTAARAIGQRWRVASNQADIFSGPSVAYSNRGRVYQGEFVTILEVTSNQEWAKVNTPAGMLGWLRVSQLQRPQDQVATDPGRRRRQTEYRYDAQGRRVNSAGQAIGSGQGTDAIGAMQASDDPEADARARAIAFGEFSGGDKGSAFSVELLPIGITYFARRFSSDIGTAPLSGVKSSSFSPSFGIQMASDLNAYVRLDGRFVAALGSEVPLPAIPALADIPASEVRAHQYTGDLQVSAGVPLNQMVWLGGVVGAQYFELGYKEVLYPTPAEKLAPLQTHSYLSATLGARMMFKWSELSLDIRGGGALPLMFNQSPNSEGQWSSFGVWTRTRLGYQLSSSFAVALSLGYIRYGADYTGPAQQADYTFEQPVYYTAASGSDQSAEAQISMSYQL